MQPRRPQPQQVIQDGHQVAIAVKDPGDGDRLGGALHGGQHELPKVGRRAERAGLVGDVVKAPQKVEAHVDQVLGDHQLPVDVAAQHLVHQARIVLQGKGKAIHTHADQHWRHAQLDGGSGGIVALFVQHLLGCGVQLGLVRVGEDHPVQVPPGLDPARGHIVLPIAAGIIVGKVGREEDLDHDIPPGEIRNLAFG